MYDFTCTNSGKSGRRSRLPRHRLPSSSTSLKRKSRSNSTQLLHKFGVTSEHKMAKHRPPCCMHLIFFICPIRALFVNGCHGRRCESPLFFPLYLENRGGDHQRLSAIRSVRSTDPPFSDINDSRRHTCIPKSGQRIFQVRQARAEKQ